MTDQDKREFNNIMQGLAEDKGIQLSAAGIGLKFEALKQFDITDIRRSAIAMMGGKKYSTMPSVSDFMDYLGGGRVEDNAEVQAAIVWQSIKKYGSVRSVVFDDAVTMAVIAQAFGGWQKLCAELVEDQLQWFMKDFARHYVAFRRSSVAHYGMLPGYADPFGKGPVLIGNAEKAQHVLDAGQSDQVKIGGGSVVAQLVEKMTV